MRELDLKICQNRKAAVFLLIFLIIFPLFGCMDINNPPPIEWEPAKTLHSAISTNSFKLLWSRSDVYIAGWATNGLAASSDKVFIIGSLDINESAKLIALDMFTGDPIWESESKRISKIFTTEDGVYVDEDGRGGSIKKYDPATGDVLWFRQFWDSGGVFHIIIYNEQLHVYLSPDKHKVLRPSDGKTIPSIHPESPLFFDLGVCGLSYQTPLYTRDTIFYRSNQVALEGEICAVDYSSGEMRWKSELGVISNIVTKDDAVFALVEGGDLLILNSITGEELPNLTISFDNTPFPPYSTQTTTAGYFLAYDIENNVLVVYTGDSHQIFVFELVKK